MRTTGHLTLQVAELFFGADAHPHDYLHEVLFRLLAVGWIGAATQNLVNKVCMLHLGSSRASLGITHAVDPVSDHGQAS